MRHGSALRSAHQTYWSNHPRAVGVLERHRDRLDKFMVEAGASNGLMTLTTGLSRPFRHLEKYAGLAQELEKHMEEDHADRGDTQRSVGFFKALSTECAKLRRQKELELEVLTGAIRNWEGDAPINALGEILHMGSVAVGHDHKDRYLILFKANLVILSVSARMSAFVYEGKLALSGIAVNRLEDKDAVMNAFEITGPLIERILVVCQSKPDSLKWVEVLQSQIKTARQFSATQSPLHKAVTSSPQTKRPLNVKANLWKMSCLRPAPPTRSAVIKEAVSNKKGGKKESTTSSSVDTTYEEDMQMLRVIEAYANQSNNRNNNAASSKS